MEIDSTAGNGEVYLTPPETPNGAGKMSESRLSSDTEGERDSKMFVRRSSRKRSATDFFQFEVLHEVELEEQKPKKSRKKKSSEGSATPSRNALDGEAVRRSLFSEITPQKSTNKVKMDVTNGSAPSEEPVSRDLASIEEEGGNKEGEDAIVAPPFSIGTLVFGKLKGYDWWPGRVASHNEIGMPLPPPNHSWIRWYGENQVSDVPYESIESLINFSDRVVLNKLKGPYRKGIIAILKEAAKRSGKEFAAATPVATPKEETPASSSSEEEKPPLCSKEESLAPRKQKGEQEGKKTGAGKGEELQEVTTPPARKYTLPSGRNGVRLSPVEEDMLQWAMERFPPRGEEGLRVPMATEHVKNTVSAALRAPSTSLSTPWEGAGSTKRTVQGRAKLNEDSGEILEAPPKRTPFHGAIALREIITVPGGRIDTFDMVREKNLGINDICLACGHMDVTCSHPLFHGGLCKVCRECFMECVYLFDDDGSQMYCTICSAGEKVFMCDKPNCAKVYCGPCIRKLCGQEELDKVEAADQWFCYMCVSGSDLLQVQEDWHSKLHSLFTTFEQEYELPVFPPAVPPQERKAIRVLGLFDGIATGMLVIKDLGIEVELYISSEVDADAIKVSKIRHPDVRHVGDVENVTEKQVREWGPFDLVIGGSPCNDLSIVNPARKGIYDGTGRLFFEFYRILNYCKPPPGDDRPFFWLFENVVSMRAHDKQIISRFLQTNPVVVDAKDISAAHRGRYFWGNLPGMSRPTTALPGDRLSLQACLEKNVNRIAQFHKLRTITTKMNSIKQTKKAIMPVRVEGEGEDVLWCTEMERLFGFPDHYTDVANLGRHGRHKLLGRAWSVPVIRHLFSPLKDYFTSSTSNQNGQTVAKGDHRTSTE